MRCAGSRMTRSVACRRRTVPSSAPQARVIKKQLSAVDAHCRAYIERSPFLILATVGASALLDVSPRGGVPGFVKIVDRASLPTMGKMINDQTGVTTPAETQADMITRYLPDL